MCLYRRRVGFPILHKHIDEEGNVSGHEHRIPGTNYKVDGYYEHDTKKIVVEFLGSYYHGDPKRFNRDEYNKTCHKNHGQLYDETMERMRKIYDLGYTVVYIWERSFNDWDDSKDILDFVQHISSSESPSPHHPQEPPSETSDH